MASKYLEAANRYRDMLQDDERSMLDAYLKELAKVKPAVRHRRRRRPSASPSGGAASPAVAPAVTAASPGTPTASPGPVASAGGVAGMGCRRRRPSRGPAGCCTKGASNCCGGTTTLAQAKVERPDRSTSSGACSTTRPTSSRRTSPRSRPKPSPRPPAADAGQPHDRRTAKAKLHEARAMLNNRQFEQAEALALEVKRWGLSYGLFDDTPDKVAAAARALRRRDQIRNSRFASGRARVSTMSWCRNRGST